MSRIDSRARAIGLAGLLVAWNHGVTPRVPARWHPLPQVAFGTAAAVASRAHLGLRPPALWAGLRLGATVAAVVAAGVASGAALPPVRARMAARELPDAIARWLLLRIPLGTVWSEEAAFRGALGAVGAEAFGRSGGRLLQAAAFGLSHIADARGAGEPVLPTVLATGAAGWVFGWLFDRSGSLAAPMLAHLAINEAGAVGTLAVKRRPA
jgi:membrane protease YdiL (CAAX protease family)